jgi:ornithine cyclodeaminase/alanine dehydrogenase
MVDIIAAVEDVFREKGEGRIAMPPKIGIDPAPNAFLNAMPGYVASARAAGVKWVSIYAKNIQRGLPAISGLMILNETETGLPLAVMDCIWITAKRTGAASAVAAKYLARKGTTLSRRRSAIRFDRLIHQGRRGSPWREICFTSCAHMV